MEKTMEDFKQLVLQKEKEGKVVIITWDGLMFLDLEKIIKQPTEGLLYDLNRDKATVLTFINETPARWVNDYAVGLVIARLKEYYDRKITNQPLHIDRQTDGGE